MTNPYTEYKELHTVGHMGHIQEYSIRDVNEFLKNTGFKVMEVIRKTYNRSRKGLIVDLFYSMMPFMRPYQIIVSKKV